MVRTRSIQRLAVLIAVGLAAACIGPQGSHREGKSWPTQPVEPHSANLFGRVVDFETGLPIADAKVNVGIDSATTNADGRYHIEDIRAHIVIVITSAAGYDSSQSQIPLPDGDKQWDMRLRAVAAGWISP